MAGSDRPMHVTLLGTGTSTGVPVIGCRCRVCCSSDPRDARTRCACYVRAGEMGIVIDTGPDFRQQMLREAISRIDAVLFTHHHFDHVVGVDDLRPYFFQNAEPMACYAYNGTARELRRMFPYIFDGGATYGAAPRLQLREVEEAFTVSSRYGGDSSLEVVPLKLLHGTLRVYGYRIGRFAYITDANHIPVATYDRLRDVDVLVIDALRHAPHPRHFTIDEALVVAERIGARQTYLVHITHNVLHAEEDARLPEGVALGYDGLTFEINS